MRGSEWLTDEFPELARRTVDRAAGGEGSGPAARDELAGTARHPEFALLHDDAPAAGDEFRPAAVDMALVGGIAHGVVHHGVVDALLDVGAPEIGRAHV